MLENPRDSQSGNNSNNNRTQKPITTEERLQELLDIKKELDAFRAEEIGLHNLSEQALNYLDGLVDIDYEIQKEEKILDLENEQNSLDAERENIKEKINTIQNRRFTIKSEIESLEKEFDRVDGSGISTKDLTDQIEELEKEEEKLNLEIEKLTEDLEKLK